ncbi:MAG TPA: NUDIX hydrolase [Burkholderiaceae bacterium]|nr:NUDIX hydrolase [Burkholderiaceae bacterium]
MSRPVGPSGDAAAADAGLIETCIESRQVFAGRLLDVRLDHVRLPNGHVGTREYVVHPGAAMIVPLHADGTVTMVRQFRYPLGRVFLEFPAGKRDPGEPTFVTAQRELAEEVGLAAARWSQLTVIHNAIAYSDEAIELYLAEDMRPVEQRLDDEEFLDVVRLPLDEVVAQVVRGELTDVKTLIGALAAAQVRAGTWPRRPAA